MKSIFGKFFSKKPTQPEPVKVTQANDSQNQLDQDWSRIPSKAHFLFLSKFLQAKPIDFFTKDEGWISVLKESPTKAAKRFLDQGFLEQADLANTLDFKYKATEIKSLLKSLGLPLTGRKEELIQRLIQSDADFARKSVNGLILCLCSTRGKAIIERFQQVEGEIRQQVEEEVGSYLKARQFRGACMAIAAYEADQVFSRGLNIDWAHYDSTRDVEILNGIFNETPEILVNIPKPQLEILRFTAGMNYLWGTSTSSKWLPSDVKIDSHMDAESVSRMFISFSINLQSLREYRSSKVVGGVEILTATDSCEDCKALSGKEFSLKNPPELPNPKCTHSSGCRCCYAPITKY